MFLDSIGPYFIEVHIVIIGLHHVIDKIFVTGIRMSTVFLVIVSVKKLPCSRKDFCGSHLTNILIDLSVQQVRTLFLARVYSVYIIYLIIDFNL